MSENQLLHTITDSWHHSVAFFLFALLIVTCNNKKTLRKGFASSQQCFFYRCTLRTHALSLSAVMARPPRHTLSRPSAAHSRRLPNHTLLRAGAAFFLAILGRVALCCAASCRPLAALAGALLGLGRAALILNAQRQVSSDMNFTKLRQAKRMRGRWGYRRSTTQSEQGAYMIKDN
jgi:hypothetical protein